MQTKKHHTKFTARERDLLAVWKAEGLSNGECARRLGRHISTIGRELKRNAWQGSYYVAIHAQARAWEREEKKAHSKQPLKNPDVYAYVTQHLRDGWSPDQIAGRLKREHPEDRHWRITAETIYRWIYHPDQAEARWWEYLRRKQKKRKKRNGRKRQRSRIPDRVSIRHRPAAVNERQEPGHWEGDTVEGKRHKDGIHTEVERISRFMVARKVPAISSEATITVQQQIFSDIPACLRRSTTLDNGRENHLHAQLKDLGMQTYFADPYSSWQRGTNENGNWHLRYYFPKGTDFATVTDEELQDVIAEINDRPRKILGYCTAREVFTHLTVQETRVAINY
jgi:IS30 family transposase